ncbi:hypothetical protein ES703_80121 [subsurface metagenome]
MEMNYTKEDLEKLRYAFPGLNIYFLALVWDFAEYLLRLQAGLEQFEQAKRD